MRKEIKKYLLVGIIMFVLITLVGCGSTTFNYNDESGTAIANAYFPITKWDQFGVGGSWDWLVYPMAWLMGFIAKYLVGSDYALTILIATILIRSLAWPIYGKTNDMQLKMKILAPEQAKIEARYKDKVDKESQQRKSMEMMQLYKKYKISFSGCFMPFLQMPIFLAFYETLKRIPFSIPKFLNVAFTSGSGEKLKEIQATGLLYDFSTLKTSILGIDLMEGSGAATFQEWFNTQWTWQRWGICIIALLVGITQIGTQLLSQKRANKQKDKMESNVPEYRRPAQTDQQKQSDRMMKIMLYSMPIIMVIFILTNTAALGWYWLVGNIYTAIQSLISAKTSEKRLEALKNKYETDSYIGKAR